MNKTRYMCLIHHTYIQIHINKHSYKLCMYELVNLNWSARCYKYIDFQNYMPTVYQALMHVNAFYPHNVSIRKYDFKWQT